MKTNEEYNYINGKDYYECKHCGAKNSKNSTICSNCGKKFQGDSMINLIMYLVIGIIITTYFVLINIKNGVNMSLTKLFLFLIAYPIILAIIIYTDIEQEERMKHIKYFLWYYKESLKFMDYNTFQFIIRGGIMKCVKASIDSVKYDKLASAAKQIE